MRRMRFTPFLIGAFLVAAAAAPVAWGQEVSRTIQEPVKLSYETYRLDNGLRVILSRDTSVPVVAVNLWYHVGSANEVPGRTGFAHLFEHMMFQGSQNVGDDGHFRMIEEAGGNLNGTTSSDRTNYFQVVPSNFLEQVLWLESDRMGFLLPAMTQEKLDNQRSVVQNERRQNYDNAPYGLSTETILAALYPQDHPYSWPTIGSMADLNAASMEDVQQFFRRYYAPNNASIAIVGDFDPDQTKRWIEKYFGPIPEGPPIDRPSPSPVRLTEERRPVLEDRVQLPRLTVVWPTPAFFEPGDAAFDFVAHILGGGRSSRLYRRLVYEEQIAQNVAAYQSSRPLASEFTIVVMARPGVDLTRVLEIVDEEVDRLRREPPTQREVEAARNNFEANFIRNMETVLGRADRLNMYGTYMGDPGYLEQDFARYTALTAGDVQTAVREYLGEGRVVLSVVPEGQTELRAATATDNVYAGAER